MSQSHTRVCRKIEDKASQEGEEHAGDDDIHDEVQWKPQHEEVVGYVQVRGVWAAGVKHLVLPATEILHHPLSTFHEVTQIRAVTVLVERSSIQRMILFKFFTFFYYMFFLYHFYFSHEKQLYCFISLSPIKLFYISVKQRRCSMFNCERLVLLPKVVLHRASCSLLFPGFMLSQA